MERLEVYRYWGKADSLGEKSQGLHLLPYHSLDVAAVASMWWDIDESMKNSFLRSANTVEVELKAWVLFFVALHDFGKFDFRFQRKSLPAALTLWPDFENADDDKRYDHGAGGYGWFVSEAEEYYGLGASQFEAALPWVKGVTGHHGRPPAEEGNRPCSSHYADEAVLAHDRKARSSWFSALESLFLAPKGLSLMDTAPVIAPLMAGFCSVCDWLGSNTDYFPYVSGVTTDIAAYFLDRKTMALRALKESGLVEEALSHGGFSSLFPDYRPKGVQIYAKDWPLEPGFTIIEAPTGSGKTEAALSYASRLLAGGLADGIIFALPTQATANAMLERLEEVATKLFPLGSNIVLAHGKARYNPAFINLKNSAIPHTAQGEDEALVQCARWLGTSRKRVFLGQIGVCTIDQVLLSVLPVRHNFVRTFGVQKSVLIVDEVHAYDSYMCALLSEVLKGQRMAGGSALLLSATLPASQRERFLSDWEVASVAEETTEYPLVTHASGVVRTWGLPAEERPEGRSVRLTMHSSKGLLPDEELLEEITNAAGKGVSIAIICNLVADAQCLYSALRNKTPRPVRLFHSRYRFIDRQKIEQEVVSLYGKEGKREGGSILVATQVIEQSLDLDFDWMITQICPVDLLFQRLGRLHRHNRLRPDGFTKPSICVLTTNNSEYGLHKLIYGNIRVLWRTEELLKRNPDIKFPEAYREWIEEVYSEDDWPDEPEDVISDAEKFEGEEMARRFKARQVVESAINPLSDTDEVTSALTRDGEMSLNVLLVTEVSGRECLLDNTPLDALGEWEREERINLNTVPVPQSWRGVLPTSGKDGTCRLKMKAHGDEWISTDAPKVFTYTAKEGLKKEDKDESID